MELEWHVLLFYANYFSFSCVKAVETFNDKSLICRKSLISRKSFICRKSLICRKLSKGRCQSPSLGSQIRSKLMYFRNCTVISRFTGPRFTVSLDITCLFVFPRFTVPPIYRSFLFSPEKHGKSGDYCYFVIVQFLTYFYIFFPQNLVPSA